MKREASCQDYYSEIDQIDKFEWTELLQQFDDATIYQTWSYGAVRWGESNLSHLVLKRGSEVIGLAQLCIKKLPIIGAGIAYIPWGPLWQIREKTKSIEHIKKIVNALKEEYVERRGLLLRIAPNIVDNGQGEVRSILEEDGFQLSKTIPPRRTLMVDLTLSLQELRKGLDQKWRNQLNRAERNSLKIVDGDSDDLYQKFMALQNEMLDRKKFIPGVSYEEFGEIQKYQPDFFKMKIIICEHEGKPITATIISAIGNTGIYMLGATGDKGVQLKGAYLSQWLIIKWLKDRGCLWYDLGGINPEKNPGVFHFKSGLSGIDVYHIGQYEICYNLISRVVVLLGYKMKTLIDKILH